MSRCLIWWAAPQRYAELFKSIVRLGAWLDQSGFVVWRFWRSFKSKYLWLENSFPEIKGIHKNIRYKVTVIGSMTLHKIMKTTTISRIVAKKMHLKLVIEMGRGKRSDHEMGVGRWSQRKRDSDSIEWREDNCKSEVRSVCAIAKTIVDAFSEVGYLVNVVGYSKNLGFTSHSRSVRSVQ